MPLSDYEQRLKEEYVKKEDFFRVGEKSVICVLTIKGGFELLGYVSNNAYDKNFTEEELKDIACKNAYESLEDFDRFCTTLSK